MPWVTAGSESNPSDKAGSPLAEACPSTFWIDGFDVSEHHKLNCCVYTVRELSESLAVSLTKFQLHFKSEYLN